MRGGLRQAAFIQAPCRGEIETTSEKTVSYWVQYFYCYYFDGMTPGELFLRIVTSWVNGTEFLKERGFLFKAAAAYLYATY